MPPRLSLKFSRVGRCRSRRMGNSQSIAPNIQHATSTGVLQLVGKKLEQWPPELDKIGNNLRTIDLTDNRLTALPSTIGQLNHLKQLTIVRNRLRQLPDQLCQLTMLTRLELDRNQLERLPIGFEALKSLKKLTLAGNRFKELPPAVCRLPSLELLDASENLIVELPANEIGSLTAVELNLNQNRLKSLPDGLADCKRLKILRLEENCLGIEQFNAKLLKESAIHLLAIEGNMFLMKQFNQIDGYEEYQKRYTEMKRRAEH